MRKMISFDKMIMPIFIKFIFWIAMIASIIGGIGTIGFGLVADTNKFSMIIMGLLILLIGPIVVRLYAEMLIVIFKMQESLIQIRDAVRQNESTRQTDFVEFNEPQE